MTGGLPVVAGAVATGIFVVSYLPMLWKAGRTRDMRSYSLGNILLANVGNAIYSVYVFHLPAGPVWVLHSYYLVSSALMLVWFLRYAVGRSHDHERRNAHHRSGPGRPGHRLPSHPAGPAGRHPRRPSASRRQLAATLDLAAPVNPRKLRRPAGIGPSRPAVVASRQGPLADLLVDDARRHELPIHSGVTVVRVTRTRRRYHVMTSGGECLANGINGLHVAIGVNESHFIDGADVTAVASGKILATHDGCPKTSRGTRRPPPPLMS